MYAAACVAELTVDVVTRSEAVILTVVADWVTCIEIDIKINDEL